MKVHYPKLYNMAHLLALNVLLLPKDLTIILIDWNRVKKYVYFARENFRNATFIQFLSAYWRDKLTVLYEDNPKEIRKKRKCHFPIAHQWIKDRL